MDTIRTKTPEAVVAARPRGVNGIPEVDELDHLDELDQAPSSVAPVISGVSRRTPPESSMPLEWIAAVAVVAGAVAAIVGCAREFGSRSVQRQSAATHELFDGTKPHGDKLLPHGQHHW